MGKIKVLIADDMTAIAEMIKKELEKIENIEVIDIAEDGQKEYEKILDLKPNLVFTDNKMPNMNGIEVIEKVVNSDVEKKPKFVLVTGDYDIELFNKARELGVINIINKPISYEKIKVAIDEYNIDVEEIDIKKQERENSIIIKKESIWKRILNFLKLNKTKE